MLTERARTNCFEETVKFGLFFILLLLIPVLGFAQKDKSSQRETSGTRTSRIVMEEMMVPSTDGIQIYVRNKHLANLKKFTAQKTLLFVHGALFPSETCFDITLDGVSWMDYVASFGYDVYMMDVRGFGRSTWPPEMNEPADKNQPVADTQTAVRDLGAVVQHILSRRKIEKLNLLGWSWGTTTTAGYAASNPGKIARLVLYAPLWVRETPSQPEVQFGAYRTVTRDEILDGWMTAVPEGKKAGLIPAGWFDQWWNEMLATDPRASSQTPSSLRTPAGPNADGQKFWRAGKPTYDPAKLSMPILLVQGEWDQLTPPYMSRSLFPLLVNAPEKRYVLIGEGTHALFMEKNRLQLFREVQAFLDESAFETK